MNQDNKIKQHNLSTYWLKELAMVHQVQHGLRKIIRVTHRRILSHENIRLDLTFPSHSAPCSNNQHREVDESLLMCNKGSRDLRTNLNGPRSMGLLNELNGRACQRVIRNKNWYLNWILDMIGRRALWILNKSLTPTWSSSVMPSSKVWPREFETLLRSRELVSLLSAQRSLSAFSRFSYLYCISLLALASTWEISRVQTSTASSSKTYRVSWQNSSMT